MLSAIEFPIVKVLSGGGIFSVAYWGWRITKNRKIGSIRNQLLSLGVSNDTAVRCWMGEWCEDHDIQRRNAASTLLASESTRIEVQRAVSSLVSDAELEPAGGFLARLSMPVHMVVGALFPFSVNANDRATLDKYSDFLLAELERFRTVRHAGHVIRCGKETITLHRLLHMRRYGEVWLAAVDRDGKIIDDLPTHDRRIVHFITNGPKWKGAPKAEDVNGELKPLADVAGILQASLGTDDDIPFAITEYLPGGTLKEWLTHAEDERVHLDKEEVMRTIIGALAEAHRRKIFHRLLCPSKILLTATFDPRKPHAGAHVKIADFWLSRLTNESPDPIYAQPKSKRGDDLTDSQRDAKNDVFALGVTWYQFMMDDSETERPPYDFFDQLDDTGRKERDWIKVCLACTESRVDDLAKLQEQMNGAKGPDTSPKPSMPPLPDAFDVSDLLHDYLMTTA